MYVKLVHGLKKLTLIVAITSTPSLSDEMDRLTLDFKNVLSNIFDISKPSELPEYTHLQMDQHSLPTTITIKGPLNVQQYYELSGKKMVFWIQTTLGCAANPRFLRYHANSIEVWKVSS